MEKAVDTEELQINCSSCTVRSSNSLGTGGVVVPWGGRAGPCHLEPIPPPQ